MVYSEFRDGDVPAGHEQLRVLKASLGHLPDSVKQVALRSDNLNATMKRLALGKDWRNARMKALRFHLIGLPGRAVSHARRLIVRLGGGAQALPTLLDARARIRALAPGPAG